MHHALRKYIHTRLTMNNAKATADGALGQIGMKYISRTFHSELSMQIYCVACVHS